jgi:hypothetical protein
MRTADSQVVFKREPMDSVNVALGRQRGVLNVNSMQWAWGSACEILAGIGRSIHSIRHFRRRGLSI